jgi:lipopolysaccharide transport system ATP-binding protein
MSQPIIEVENLSKLYRVGARSSLSIRDSVEGFFRKLGWQKDPEWSHRKKRQMPALEFSPEQRGSEPNTFWALKDINFTVNEGEVIGVIGRNGAGKSTLLKILSHITEPSLGRAVLRGRVASLLEVGTGFHPDLTGRENVYLNGAILGMRRWEINRNFKDIVEFAEVEKFIDTPVKHYSSGMYVRLAFAVAAHLNPEILLVDEVLAVGDFIFQTKCMDKMRAASQSGRTILFVSHNLGAIERLCTRTILLKNGQVAFMGPSREGIREYISYGITKRASFEKPSNPEKIMSIRKIEIMTKAGEIKNEFRFDEAIQIVVEYEVNQPTQSGSVWVDLVTAEGVFAFGSSDVDATPNEIRKLGKGYYVAAVDIPASWLNAGSYNVVVGANQCFPVISYDRVDEVSFSILDIGTPEQNRTGHSRHGVLQPLLNWKTTQRN